MCIRDRNWQSAAQSTGRGKSRRATTATSSNPVSYTHLYALLPTFRTRLSCIGNTIPFAETPYEFQQKTVGIKKETKIMTVGKIPLLPLTGVHHKHPINFSQDITSYTAKGREKIHKSVQCVETQELRNVMKYRNPNESI